MEKQKLWRREYKRAKRRAMGIETAQERSERLATVRSQNKQHIAHVIEYRKTDRYKEFRQQQLRELSLEKAKEFKHRYRNDPEFRAKQIMRAVIRKASKRYGWVSGELGYAVRRNKKGRIWDLLGYSAEELVRHIQKQFTKGMTIEHFMRGDIHIDHIIPKSLFNLETIEDLRRCHALSNLRPLWAKDNLAKSARIECLL